MWYVNLDTQDVNLAMESANHDFTAEKQRLTTERNNLVPDHVAIVKSHDQQYLGTVGIGWEPVQPNVVYELAAELITATGGKINGAINMFNGAVMGISFKLADREYIEGDPIELNFLMMNSFNGTHGIAGHATSRRVLNNSVCNTSNKVYSLKHTRHVGNRIQVVKNMLKYYEKEIDFFDQKMMGLINKSMNDQEAVDWFKSLFPTPKSPRAETMMNNQIGYFMDCLHNGEGNNLLGVKGTSYAAFQALTEYINKYRPVRVHNNREEDEVRFQAIHFGSGNTLTQKGLNNLTVDFEFSEEEFKI